MHTFLKATFVAFCLFATAASAGNLRGSRLVVEQIGEHPAAAVGDAPGVAAIATAATSDDHFHRRRLGRFHGGITFDTEVSLPDEVTRGSTSVPKGKTFSGFLGARFGGAEQCCAADTYANPATTVRWSEWAAARAAIAAHAPVVVPCGTRVLLDASPGAPLKGLRIEGSLVVEDNGASIDVDTGYVYNCGELKADLRRTKLTFTLVGHEKIPGKAAFSTKAFVTQGGDLDLRGAMCNRTTWTLLDATADAGATELQLEDPVAWPVGTEIMVASTDFKGTQTEVATVAAIKDSGRTLVLAAGLVYPHAGVAPITAEVAALSRNVKITSEASCAAIPNAEADNKPMCGHFVIDHTPRGVVCGVEITNMGKHTTTGKYPLHAHMCGDAPDLQIRSNAVHSNHHRALVIHGTSNATWAENVVFRSVGHLLLTEDGGEEGNRVVRNVLALPMQPSPSWPEQCPGVDPNSPYGGCEIKRCSHGTGIYEAVCGNRHDGETAAMWISNPANYFAHNRIIAGRAVGVRFETRGTTGRVALLPKDELRSLFHVGADLKSQGRAQGLGGFVGNVIHSSKHGIFNYPSWNPDDGVHIEGLVAWKNANAVFAKTKYAYKNPNMADGHRIYNLDKAVLLMNQVAVYTIHDDSKLHVSNSVLAPQLPAHLYPEASRDPVAAAGACASEAAATMCGARDYCTVGKGALDDGDAGGLGDGVQTSVGTDTAVLREDVTTPAACRALPGGRWHKAPKDLFQQFEWREAHPAADGTIARPFGDWYFALEAKRYRKKFGRSSLDLRSRPWCRERVFASTFKDGVVDPSYRFSTSPTQCVGATGASPSIARRVSAPSRSNSHQFPVFKAFKEGKHYVEGLPWSISVDEATLAGARRNGYATWEELGAGAGARKDAYGVNGEVLPKLQTSPLPCAARGCYLQAGGMQAHLGSHNKGYISYTNRRRLRHPIVFPARAAVLTMQEAGRDRACTDQGGAWELVFRQRGAFRYDPADDWAQARRHNAGNPEADNYSALFKLATGPYRDEEGRFTFQLRYPDDPIAFGTSRNGAEDMDKQKRQENLRVWRQTSDPTARATCVNDGARKKGENKNVATESVGNCGVEGFENLFPTEWVPLAGKWGGLEYQGSDQAFLDGSSFRRFGDSQVGYGKGGQWTVGSAQRYGPLAGDAHHVASVELFACNLDGADNDAVEIVPDTDDPYEEEEGLESDPETADPEEADPEGDAPGGRWRLVFRQTAPFVHSRGNDWAGALSLNEDDESNNNFSKLGRLEQFRDRETGAFRFQLRYPTVGTANVWEQRNNPAVRVTCPNNKGKTKTGNCGVDGFAALSTGAGAESGVPVAWGGLEYNGDKALMDGSIGAGNTLWYAIGARRTARNYRGVKRFPTYPGDVEETKVELFVWDEDRVVDEF